eukprot:GHVR01067265.1.p1 GENE.GHVR01067265.1~~GHVR01067265.1.p1  ORF type:complete len:260 (+),score=46.44 GHVR01067265.1:45-824(+)
MLFRLGLSLVSLINVIDYTEGMPHNMYDHVESQLINIPIVFTPINAYNTFKINLNLKDTTSHHICVLSPYTDDIIIEYNSTAYEYITLESNGCTPVPITKKDKGILRYRCTSRSSSRSIDIISYPHEDSIPVYDIVMDHIKNPINCIIGVSGVYNRDAQASWDTTWTPKLFFDKAFKYSKHITDEGGDDSGVIELLIVDKGTINIRAIKPYTRIHTCLVDNKWRVSSSPQYHFNLSKQGVTLGKVWLNKSLPLGCRGCQ